MVLVHNLPSPINLSETHGQSKLNFFVLAAAVQASAPSYRRGKRHIFPRSDPDVVKVKRGLLGPRREKLLPGRHVGI